MTDITTIESDETTNLPSEIVELACYVGVPSDVVIECESDYRTSKLVWLEAMRRIRDRLAAYGQFEQWCKDHEENYKAVSTALSRAFGNRSKQAVDKASTEPSLLELPSDAAVRHAAEMEALRAELESKVREALDKASAEHKRAKDAEKKLCQVSEEARAAVNKQELAARTALPAQAGRDDAIAMAATKREEDHIWRVREYVGAGVAYMHPHGGQTPEERAEYLFRVLPMGFFETLHRQELEKTRDVLTAWLALVNQQEREDEAAESGAAQ